MSSYATSIPVIDLSKTSEAELAKELVEALETIGFATLVHHGVDAMESALEAAREFFALETAIKLQYPYQGHESNRGYIAFGSESHQDFAVTDMKETFDIGPEQQAEDDADGQTTKTPWPAEVGDSFRSTLLQYFDQCNRLQLRLLRVLAMGLALQSDFFTSKCDQQHCNLRLLHYPSIRVSPATSISGADSPNNERIVVRGARHTDFGTLTLVAQDAVGGLRVQPRHVDTHYEDSPSSSSSSPWISVTPTVGALVVNVGDMLQRWTNDRLKATPHQVVSVIPQHQPTTTTTTSTTTTRSRSDGDDDSMILVPERFSIAFFCNANMDVVVEPCVELLRDGQAPMYEPITAMEYLTQRLAATIQYDQ